MRIYVVCTDAGSDEASAFRIAKQELFSDASQPNVILISTFCFMHQIHLGVKKGIAMKGGFLQHSGKMLQYVEEYRKPNETASLR